MPIPIPLINERSDSLVECRKREIDYINEIKRLIGLSGRNATALRTAERELENAQRKLSNQGEVPVARAVDEVGTAREIDMGPGVSVTIHPATGRPTAMRENQTQAQYLRERRSARRAELRERRRRAEAATEVGGREGSPEADEGGDGEEDEWMLREQAATVGDGAEVQVGAQAATVGDGVEVGEMLGGSGRKKRSVKRNIKRNINHSNKQKNKKKKKKTRKYMLGMKALTKRRKRHKGTKKQRKGTRKR